MEDETAPGPSFTARIAMWSSRHRRVVVLGWIILIIAAIVACSSVTVDDSVSGDAPGEAGEAFDLIEARYGSDEEAPQEIIVFRHPTLTVDDAEYREVVTALLADLRALRVEDVRTVAGSDILDSKRIVARTTSHYDTSLPRDISPFVAISDTRGDTTFAMATLEGEYEDLLEDIDVVIDEVDSAAEANPDFEILIGGDVSASSQAQELVNEDFARASTLNLPITFAILILAFGALIAAAVPIILAFVAVIVAMGALALISQVYALADVYSQIVLLIGLATGIDYSMFVINRWRTERAAGRTTDDSLRVAFGTSGKAIFFAGSTTIFAVAGMFLVGDSIFSSLGLASMVIVVFAVSSGLTLLPAILGFMGDNINRLRIPFLYRARTGGTGWWGAVVDFVLARPLLPAVLTVIALIAISAPTAGLNLGFNGARAISDDAEAKKALIALEEDFTLGLIQPAIVVVDAGEKGNVFDSSIQQSIGNLAQAVTEESVASGDPEAYYGIAARAPEYNDAGDTAQFFIPVNGDSADDRSIDAVNHLRDNLVPEAFEDSAAEQVLVTGATAANVDFRSKIQERTPIVFAFVLGLAFIILLLTFRSLVIAVTAIGLNLFSVFVAYGLLVLVFQEGYLGGETIFNFEATGVIESWLPLFLFSLLFGLSIDYEMFVMGRIKEKYEEGLPTNEAISEGIKGTAGVITNAAAIMVAVALIFAFTRNIGLQQFGFGLAVAIFVDATIIRTFLLPTTMKLLGEWNWYLPSWLSWLPRLPMAEETPEPPVAQPGPTD
jgi:uncharacterized membrane protein YdfJ with MMPL/SSD domain